ncbi:MAG: phosphodiester glycosidase family protein [Pyrinomonadaceae bacterium]
MRSKANNRFQAGSAIGWIFAFFFSLFSIPTQTNAQEYRSTHDGIDYAAIEHRIGDDPVRIKLLRLDTTKVRLDVIHAMDAALGTERTSSIARRHGAVAAINAGFFRLDTSIFAGDAASLLTIDGRLLSESSNGRAAIAINNQGGQSRVAFGRVQTRLSLYTGKDPALPVAGVNRERKENEIIIFTKEFGRTTLTDPNGSEFIVRSGAEDGYFGKVISERSMYGSTEIPRDGFVVSASGGFSPELSRRFRNRNLKWRVGVEMSGNGGPLDPAFHTAEDIVAGVPQLIKDGKIDIDWEREGSSKAFVETRHPRTAVAKLSDGRLLFVTVDGRQPGVSVGMNLIELAEYLLALDAVDAINLDGGGSTTMYLDGKVVNTPSDKTGERKVSDAILIKLRNTRVLKTK